MFVLTRHMELWEVREGVEVAGSASSTHGGHYLSVQCSIWSVATWHAPLFWKLGLETRGWATLPKSSTHPHCPPIQVTCWWGGKGGGRGTLVARGAALSWQVPVSLIWCVVPAVHRVTVQTGASLRHLRNRWVMGQNRTSMRKCDRWLPAEHRAALDRLTQRWLSAEDRAPFRPLSKRGLSAEDWAALSPLRQMTTEDGTATGTRNAHIKAINCWCLLAHGGTVVISGALLEDRTVSGANDVGPVLRMRTSMAECGLRGLWGGRAGIWGHMAPKESIGVKVWQCMSSSAKVGRCWRAGIQVGWGGSTYGLIWQGVSGVGALCGLGMESWISSGLGQSANTALC